MIKTLWHILLICYIYFVIHCYSLVTHSSGICIFKCSLIFGHHHHSSHNTLLKKTEYICVLDAFSYKYNTMYYCTLSLFHNGLEPQENLGTKWFSPQKPYISTESTKYLSKKPLSGLLFCTFKIIFLPTVYYVRSYTKT